MGRAVIDWLAADGMSGQALTDMSSRRLDGSIFQLAGCRLVGDLFQAAPDLIEKREGE